MLGSEGRQIRARERAAFLQEKKNIRYAKTSQRNWLMTSFHHLQKIRHLNYNDAGLSGFILAFIGMTERNCLFLFFLLFQCRLAFGWLYSFFLPFGSSSSSTALDRQRLSQLKHRQLFLFFLIFGHMFRLIGLFMI